VYPASVTGHSSGEIVAAYACGALGMEDAMSIAYHRGVAASQLLTAQVQGGMMAISMSPEEVKPHLARIESGKAVIACINSPSSVTVSGDTDAIDELTKALENNPAFSRRLAVDVAYHSHHMEPVANEYLNSIEHITPRKPNIDNDLISFFSSVTGTEIHSDALGPPYWVSNLLGQVKFAESVKKLCFETNTRHTGIGITAGRRAKRAGTAQKPSVDFILEIGPHSALSPPVKQILQADVKLRAADIEYASILVRRKPAVSCALDSMTKLATLNYPLDFESINRPETSNQRVPRLLVDLPPYSWNHTRSYWAEPRMSKTYRAREFPRTNLLGALDNMACPFEPRWRNYLRVSEIPWLMDHKIQSDIVFPAAGYICIAIEAAMQLAADIGEIAAFALQDISIRSALIIPESVGIEIMTSLHTLSEGRANRSDSAYRFHVYSVSKDNRWTEHCTGIIGVERKHGDTGEVKIDLDGSAVLSESETANISVVDIGQLYARLRHVGLDYGPCFANLTSAHATESGACFAEITIPNTAAAMPMQFEHPLLIHPCALDSMFHAIFAILPDDTSLQRGPLIPVSIESIRVAGCISTCVGEVLSTCTHVRTGPEDTVVASIVAGDSNGELYSLTPMISVTGLRCKRLDLAPNDSRSSKDVPLVYEIEWQPDPEFIAKQINPCRILEQNAKFANRSSFFEGYENYTAYLIKDFLIRSAQHDRTRHDSVVNKYRSSLAELLQGENAMTKITNTGEAKQKELPRSMTRLLHAMGTHLSSISDEDPKSIQESRTELWDARWEILATNRTYQCAARYLELIGNKKPDISVLEICEGTGQPCTMFLHCLTAGRRNQHQTPRCIKYTFTFKDNAELDQMKPRLAPWSEIIGFTKLDIERDISDQGIENHPYDVIVAPHGLHSVQSMKHAIENLRSMLTPSGYLLIIDHFHTERSILDAMMINALYLWPTEIFHSPSKNGMKNNNLVEALQEAGFTTCNLAQESHPTGHNDMLMVSRLRANMELTDKSFTIISEKSHNESVVKALQDHIEDLGCKVKLTDIANIQAKGEICVLLSDMQTQMQMLASIKSDILEKVKDIFLHSAGVLWITSGGTVDPTCPEAGLASGFARTARSESGVGPIITLDLDSLNPLPDSQTAEVILSVIKTHFLQKGILTEDTEYSERGGIVSIPRVVEREDLNPAITRVSQDDTYSEQPFRQKDCPVRLARADMNHSQPYFTQVSEMAELPAGHVGIEVLAFGLSECDTYQRSGVKRLSDTLGLECSGKVCALGKGVEGFSMGDRVVCLGIGTAGTFYHNEASAFQKIDDNMSYELAADLSVAYTTAYYVVHYLARIRPHDTVLIQDAASWYGQAITEVCYMRSAAIIATVESSTEKEALSNRFRIPPHRVLIDGDENITKQILEITNGQKANVAITLSATKSQGLQEIWKCVASFGRWIQLRTRDEDERGDLSCPVRNVVFSTFDIFEFQTERTNITRHILGKIMRLFHEGRLRGPPSVMVQRVREMEEALDAITAEKHVVITTGGDDVVKVGLLLCNLRQN
jgi:acyl transferase domain-containing protein/NADPH:quinone reductase-like Zn-dependent oxidoreductase